MNHYCQRCGYEQMPHSYWRIWVYTHPIATVFISVVLALFGVFMVAVVSVYPVSGWSIVAVTTVGVLIYKHYQRQASAKALAARAQWEYSNENR